MLCKALDKQIIFDGNKFELEHLKNQNVDAIDFQYNAYTGP